MLPVGTSMLLCGRKFNLIAPLCTRNYQVTVLGAAGEIGQTVALLLRTQSLISKLVMHDWLEILPGVTLDVTHIPSDSGIQSYTGEDGLEIALRNSHVVIAAGGSGKRPGMTYIQWLESNMEFIKKISAHISRCTPMPIVGIATEPLNTIVPMAAEVMRNNGNFDSRRLLGVNTIDVLRTQCIYAADHNISSCDCFVPTICGHSSKTLVPLLSHAQPQLSSYQENYALNFTDRARDCDDAVTMAKKGWSAALSTSYGISVFVKSILEALDGRLSKVNAFVENNDYETTYFSGIVKVGEKGYGEMQKYDNLSDFEVNLLKHSVDELRKEIKIGNKALEAETALNNERML